MIYLIFEVVYKTYIIYAIIYNNANILLLFYQKIWFVILIEKKNSCLEYLLAKKNYYTFR